MGIKIDKLDRARRSVGYINRKMLDDEPWVEAKAMLNRTFGDYEDTLNEAVALLRKYKTKMDIEERMRELGGETSLFLAKYDARQGGEIVGHDGTRGRTEDGK